MQAAIVETRKTQNIGLMFMMGCGKQEPYHEAWCQGISQVASSIGCRELEYTYGITH